MVNNAGALVLVGGGEWQEGCSFDESFIADANDEVLVLPTAAAYEWPDRAVAKAVDWFSGLGATATGLPLLNRADANNGEIVERIRSARFIYLSDGSPLHLRSVIKDTLAWNALLEAWRQGATIAGSSAGAMVLGDPMVDPRGGAFTLGLGLVNNLAIVPHWETWSPERMRRMTVMIPAAVVVAEIEERTALIRRPDGKWSIEGAGKATLTLDKGPMDIDQLEAAVTLHPAGS